MTFLLELHFSNQIMSFMNNHVTPGDEFLTRLVEVNLVWACYVKSVNNYFASD